MDKYEAEETSLTWFDNLRHKLGVFDDEEMDVLESVRELENDYQMFHDQVIDEWDEKTYDERMEMCELIKAKQQEIEDKVEHINEMKQLRESGGECSA